MLHDQQIPVAGDTESDDALALAFVEAQQGDVRWIQQFRRWHIWDGQVWRKDRVLSIFDRARRFLRGAVGNPKRTLDAHRIASVERLARSDPRTATLPEDLDADLWLLNTIDGVVDLKTGERTEHKRELLITKLTTRGIGGECPLWLKFLDEVTGGDPDLVGFLQRMAGYATTGSTREHALFFLYGTGRNGKGIFLNTLLAVLGDYGTTASTDVFTVTRGDQHPAGVAALRGSRLVVAQEVGEGRRWDEAKIKALTGGDPISARFMRQDFFEFIPTFKLLISGNHKPRLGTVDEAIKARLHLIPFEVTIPPDQRDPDLAEKLKAELPGILAWAVQGCRDYLEAGLQPPERVKAATQAYFANQDLLAEFIGDRCATGPGFQETPARLFRAWCEFCNQQGEQPGLQATFRDRMEAVGYRQMRSRQGRYWVRIRLVHQTVPEHHQKGASRDV